MTTSLRLAAAALLLTAAACSKSGSETSTTTSTDTASSASATGTPIAPPAGKTWVDTLEATAEGGYRIGNPNAQVKLVEYGSVWCPHCKDFHEKSMAALKEKYIATGKVSYERRDFILNGPDMLATLLVRCDVTPALYWRRLETFYTRQADWEMNFVNLKPDELKPLQGLAQDQQMPAYAKLAKLDAFVRPQGISEAKFMQCISDKAATDRLTASNNTAIKDFNLTGTPLFIINGVTLGPEVATWEQLEPKIKAAL